MALFVSVGGTLSRETGKLIIIPTPLGNLGDVTTRTLQAFEL